jgi:hypothetical protein
LKSASDEFQPNLIQASRRAVPAHVLVEPDRCVEGRDMRTTVMRGQGLIVFDRDGYAWELLGLACHLDTYLRGRALAEYTVRNMGYVALDRCSSSARLHVRPAVVARPAVAAAVGFLREHSVQRVLLSAWTGAWCHQLLPTSVVVSDLSRAFEQPKCVGVKDAAA